MSFEEALDRASEDQRFKATVYAMNSLLQARGIYTQEEVEAAFVQGVEKQLRKSEKVAAASSPKAPALA